MMWIVLMLLPVPWSLSDRSSRVSKKINILHCKVFVKNKTKLQSKRELENSMIFRKKREKRNVLVKLIILCLSNHKNTSMAAPPLWGSLVFTEMVSFLIFLLHLHNFNVTRQGQVVLPYTLVEFWFPILVATGDM